VIVNPLPPPPPPLVSFVPEASSSPLILCLIVLSLLNSPYLATSPLALPLSCVCQDGNTALIRASLKGHTATVKLLMDAKANSELQNKVTLAEEQAESLRDPSRWLPDPIPGRFERIGVE
jgi:hypothetical protein